MRLTEPGIYFDVRDGRVAMSVWPDKRPFYLIRSADGEMYQGRAVGDPDTEGEWVRVELPNMEVHHETT
jgi:hypothetical protein